MVYLTLWNGHKPGQRPDDFGEDGPTFGPYDLVQITYGEHITMYREAGPCDDFFIGENGWIEHEGMLYGDFSVTASPGDNPDDNYPHPNS